MREQREIQAAADRTAENDAGAGDAGPGKLAGRRSKFGEDGVGFDGRPPILDDALRAQLPTLD